MFRFYINKIYYDIIAHHRIVAIVLYKKLGIYSLIIHKIHNIYPFFSILWLNADSFFGNTIRHNSYYSIFKKCKCQNIVDIFFCTRHELIRM